MKKEKKHKKMFKNLNSVIDYWIDPDTLCVCVLAYVQGEMRFGWREIKEDKKIK